ncbi:MAG: N-acetylmuramoyl-L-alanine amidase [Muribaculaceae bacterium]|nr:N-acetylmuramoyl-L-alanine amidase [Muribaculaceae bacterium]
MKNPYAILRLLILPVIFLAGMMTCAYAAGPEKSLKDNQFVVVIDPGHGGKDAGAIGSYAKEKDIVLGVGKLLGQKISQKHPEVKVVFTRNTDNYITLQERARIANNARGSLFISLHANSVAKENKRRNVIAGASVYALGLHKTESNLSVAMRENAVIELEGGDYTTAYQGFDPTSSESYIMFELTQNNHLQQSLEYADLAENELVVTAGRKRQGVMQAGFWVLWATSMPSVLVELDYICNPTQEQFLASSAGQEKCADALSNAFDKFYKHHNASAARANKTKKVTSADSKVAQVEVPQEGAPSVQQPVSGKGVLTYHVQILTNPKELPGDTRELRGLADVNYYKENSTYKYYCGCFKTQQEAQKRLNQLRSRFPQAFIIKMRDGVRLY